MMAMWSKRFAQLVQICIAMLKLSRAGGRWFDPHSRLIREWLSMLVIQKSCARHRQRAANLMPLNAVFSISVRDRILEGAPRAGILEGVRLFFPILRGVPDMRGCPDNRGRAINRGNTVFRPPGLVCELTPGQDRKQKIMSMTGE